MAKLDISDISDISDLSSLFLRIVFLYHPTGDNNL